MTYIDKTESQQLLKEIEQFLRDRAANARFLSETTFGQRACESTSIVTRLRMGGAVRKSTAERIRNWMRSDKRSWRE